MGAGRQLGGIVGDDPGTHNKVRAVMIRIKSLLEWVYARRGHPSSKEVHLHGAP